MIIDPQTSFWYDAAPQWFVAFGTLVLAFVAVFQEWLRRLVSRPRLQLSAVVSPPDCHKTKLSMGADVYYFRLRVENTGNAAARDVQVYLASVERQRADRQYEAVDRFVPMNLMWAIIRQTTLPILLPDMPPRYCDFAHITDPQQRRSVAETLPGIGDNSAILVLELEVNPNNKGYLLEPGEYRMGLKLAAENHPVRDYALEVNFRGTWFNNENEMLREGFGMRILG